MYARPLGAQSGDFAPGDRFGQGATPSQGIGACAPEEPRLLPNGRPTAPWHLLPTRKGLLTREEARGPGFLNAEKSMCLRLSDGPRDVCICHGTLRPSSAHGSSSSKPESVTRKDHGTTATDH